MRYPRAIIVSSLYCCGKTYCYRTNTKYRIIDLDEEFCPHPPSGLFRDMRLYHSVKWLEEINKRLFDYDFIFINAARSLRYALNKNNIPYTLVYPKYTEECKIEWERRNMERGTKILWEICKPSFRNFVFDMSQDPRAFCKYELKENQYISDIIDQIYKDYEVLYLTENSRSL